MTTSDFKIKHDFLKHYNEGYNDLFEDKPVDVEKTANLLKFEITVNKHGDYYDFGNYQEVVDDCLKTVIPFKAFGLKRFKPFGLKLINCWFVIENIQQSAFENLRPELMFTKPLILMILYFMG